ncbi:zona pellucida sperm-binding protein 3-like [Clupea harengus]|uniref:Zona pellucida sperm-binding protein 3-like n=1 Tax=Clupea harengus TaxID=7950 RepID=A0A6P3VGK2_CLUHA|nr:zona pellucida sperm-binding protein 3-like [Clupea harengus]
MFFLQGGLILILIAAYVAQEAFFHKSCKTDAVTIKWPLKLTQEQIQNPYTVLLGNCVPSSVTVDEVIFHVAFNDCLFQRTVSGNKIIFMNLLTYRPGLAVPAQSYIVDCDFDRPVLLTSPSVQPGIHDEKPIFIMELMKGDFSGPAQSATFTVGSNIPFRASVAEQTGVPQQIFLDECIMTTSPDPNVANDTYTVVTDEGCLLESKYGNSTFLPREKPSEIRLSLTAFGFVDADEVYLHCRLVSWEAHRLDVNKKACSYRKENQRWELLDDASQNYLCSCCNSICKKSSGGLWQDVVVGPIRILKESQESNKDPLRKSAKGLGKGTFWLLTVVVPLVLLIATGALALSYYLCVWRGGRLGYRPSRDLLNKY